MGRYASNPYPPTTVDPQSLACLNCFWRSIVRDIYEVLRQKQAEQVQLGKQIEALQNAAEKLRSVAHLLDEEHTDHDSLSQI